MPREEWAKKPVMADLKRHGSAVFVSLFTKAAGAAVVDAATSADDFRLEDVRYRRMSVYVRIPPNRLANARPLLNLLSR